MPPWFALINQLKRGKAKMAPSFPLMVGAMLERDLLPCSDPWKAGLAMLQDMAKNPYLDAQRQYIFVKTCDVLKVPVFRIASKNSVYKGSNFPNTFPAGIDGGRLRFAEDVVSERVPDLIDLYNQFYYHFKFKHDRAMENGRYSRDDRTWVDHSHCKDFKQALEILSNSAGHIEPIKVAGL